MRFISLIVFLSVIAISCSHREANPTQQIFSYQSPEGTGIYKPDSAVIAQYYEMPDWFRDAKFGVFIHWGVYSVPAFGSEWYPRNMYIEGSEEYEHHIETYGPHSEFGYKDFIPMFKAEKFDAEEWTTLFKDAGVKYVVPVAEHHDGFSMYASTINKWNSVDMGPGKDIVGELKEAALNHGLHFGLSSHRAENAWYFNGGKEFPSDVTDPEYSSLYGELLKEPGDQVPECPEGAGFNDYSKKRWLAHVYEIVDRYEPELLWFDWTVGKYPFRETFYQFMAYYYNSAIDWDKQVVVNTKFGYGNNIQVFDIERGKSDSIRKYPWQTDTSIGINSWGYIEGERNKTSNQIIDDLVDIVSKNGNLLLNIGPRSDGTITAEQRNVLMEIGAWLEVNGEAIYGSRPWIRSTEGEVSGTSGAFTDDEEIVYSAQDIRFTMKGDILYSISLAWTDQELVIQSIGEDMKVKKVNMLGTGMELSWHQTSEGLHVQFPDQKPSEYAHVLKIRI